MLKGFINTSSITFHRSQNTKENINECLKPNLQKKNFFPNWNCIGTECKCECNNKGEDEFSFYGVEEEVLLFPYFGF